MRAVSISVFAALLLACVVGCSHATSGDDGMETHVGVLNHGSHLLHPQHRQHPRGSHQLRKIERVRSHRKASVPHPSSVPTDPISTVASSVPAVSGSGSGSVGGTVDIVYTWVNGSDPDWNRQKESYKGGGSHSGASNNRFREFDHLRYSIRSLFEHCNFFRKIFLVTNGQVPHWLDESKSDKLVVVKHSDIFPKDENEDLPTFSSNAIEAVLHLIPGLGDQYIYFNDDVFLGNTVSMEDFIKGDKQVLYFETEKKPKGKGKKFDMNTWKNHKDPFYQSAYYTIDKMKTRIEGGKVKNEGQLVAHTPHLFQLSVMKDLSQQYEEGESSISRCVNPAAV
eukprot:GFYU01037820.1.p1 GENE.GFYU01037820.1~~GFYU01037820.1.p1  ORF type:complete len:369 (-),score=57.92 GFYU01037820.1:14-1027(-)